MEVKHSNCFVIFVYSDVLSLWTKWKVEGGRAARIRRSAPFCCLSLGGDRVGIIVRCRV